ncbi:MAG: ribosome assembly cofactor RimP, partial [Muribaculaceae bacterium]|nr:ribosome assembly cofactor RimP [Muribaculaceae bacterium]
MIDKELLSKTVADAIAGTDLYVIDIAVKAGNVIEVVIDSPTGVDIDACARITRSIE